jgi:hypothetical protein
MPRFLRRGDHALEAVVKLIAVRNGAEPVLTLGSADFERFRSIIPCKIRGIANPLRRMQFTCALTLLRCRDDRDANF